MTKKLLCIALVVLMLSLSCVVLTSCGSNEKVKADLCANYWWFYMPNKVESAWFDAPMLLTTTALALEFETDGTFTAYALYEETSKTVVVKTGTYEVKKDKLRFYDDSGKFFLGFPIENDEVDWKFEPLGD